MPRHGVAGRFAAAALAGGLLGGGALALAKAPTAPGGLEDFKCYSVVGEQATARPAQVSDQFGQARTQITSLKLLCNPVQKDATKVTRPLAHLTCYATHDGGPAFERRLVEVTNAFGTRRLAVVKAVSLCAPALASRAPATPPTAPNPAALVDHFRCYDVGALSAKRDVKLRDEFTTTRARSIQAVRLCNPASVEGSRVRRPGAHLVCYTIKDAKAFAPVGVDVRDRFALASVSARKPKTLCMPSFERDVRKP
jgi:hypothetical protein